MSTYTQIYYHIVFSTKERRPVLDAPRRDDLFRYVWGIHVDPLRGMAQPPRMVFSDSCPSAIRAYPTDHPILHPGAWPNI
jgi:hypothetical protein